MLHLLKCHNKITEGFVSKIIFISKWRCPQGQQQYYKQFQSSDLFVFPQKSNEKKILQSQINQNLEAVKISKFILKFSLTSNSEKS